MKYYYNNILLLIIFSFMSIGLGQTDDLTDLTLYRNLNQEGFNSAARDTGDLISSFASPINKPWGIAWDGEYLWISGSSPEWIYKVTTLGGPGELIDVIVTERGIAINPTRKDLIKATKGSGLPIRKIEEIKEEVDSLVGAPLDKPEFTDEVVGVVKWVDGTIIDSIFQVKNK